MGAPLYCDGCVRNAHAGCPSCATLRAELAAVRARFTAPIVCMCGSTRFKQSWITENVRLTGEGNIVLAVGLWGHHEQIAPDASTKSALDNLHKRKIELCDWVWVLDVGGYIGEPTLSEIGHAMRLGRPVRYLSGEFPGYVEPVDPLAVELAAVRARLAEVEREREAVERAEQICAPRTIAELTLGTVFGPNEPVMERKP